VIVGPALEAREDGEVDGAFKVIPAVNQSVMDLIQKVVALLVEGKRREKRERRGSSSSSSSVE
jgi:hypothetical protein